MAARTHDQRVYLGFIDDEIDTLDDTDPYCTKVGGSPVWLLPDGIEIPKCGICTTAMELILQAYSPLEILPTHERVMYVFACIKPGCSNRSEGWCVLRLQLPVSDFEDPHTTHTDSHEIKNETCESTKNNVNDSNTSKSNTSKSNSSKPSAIKSNSNWNSSTTWDSSDWNESTPEETLSDDLEDLLTLRDTLSLHSKSNKVTQKSSNSDHNEHKNSKKKINKLEQSNSKQEQSNNKQQQPTKGFFIPHYMVVEEETDVKLKEHTNVQIDLPQDDTEEWIGEEYEYTPNRTLSKFLKKLTANPTQCVRYVFDGRPLLMEDDSTLDKSIPQCPCGEPRTFEFQVMSTLIYLLSSGEHNKSHLDFGIVAIFVCSKSCTTVGCQREYVYVQQELNG